jgi:fructose-1,6-bisphosphatase/inositol monophosphatase family enzyme
MQHVCKRAIEIMMGLIFSVRRESKGLKLDGSDDWVTEADRECQREMVRILREQLLDTFGIGLVGLNDIFQLVFSPFRQRRLSE